MDLSGIIFLLMIGSGLVMLSIGLYRGNVKQTFSPEKPGPWWIAANFYFILLITLWWAVEFGEILGLGGLCLSIPLILLSAIVGLAIRLSDLSAANKRLAAVVGFAIFALVFFVWMALVLQRKVG
jgi:hypothetical protein